MHELGLAEDVLRLLKEEAKNKGLKKITRAKVAIGETLISDPPEFHELFAMISAGSPAEGMKLEVEISPLKAVCSGCKKEFIPKELRFDCPHCGSTDIKVASGREITIREIE
ncbi:MAG TPA: hydrogenase maturation nickel metallochaperone HypA [Candidatus Omnitrophota bacterium]|nr:hydrogenase maturation nickel metallochaperone HypA [Candidatus Omnitrophota bacterium]